MHGHCCIWSTVPSGSLLSIPGVSDAFCGIIRDYITSNGDHYVPSFGEFLRNSACVLGFYGWAYLLYLDILDYIAIPLTLLIMAVGFTAWVAHIYSVKFETSLSILFGVANLVLSILYYHFLYDPIGTVKPSWAEKLG